MKLLVVVLAVVVAVLPAPPLVASECGGNGAILFNFGDSNSDTGGSMAGLGWVMPLPHGRLFSRHPSGRLCDGRLIIDFLCESLNISYLSPYLESLGSDFRNGANFAVSGASTQASASVPFSLAVQVRQFLRFRSRSLDLVAQGSKDLIDEEGFHSALYTFDIGQNDLAGAFALNSSDQFDSRIRYTLSEIRNAIHTIYDNGGKNFWVHNTGPFGCMPERASQAREGDNDLDPYGCRKSLNDGAKAFNSGLSTLCDELNSQLRDATVVYTDIFAIKYDLVANYAEYGFESPVMACCGYGGPPFNFNASVRCGAPGCQACPVGSRFISWDGVHYTENANAMVASKVLSAEYSRPPVKFDFFCNN